MKNKLFLVSFSLFVLYLIFFPLQMAADTKAGLRLWYEHVVPALLPFSILSTIIIQSNLYHSLFSRKNRLFRNAKKNPELWYPILTGFLFGFPIGAKVTTDLYRLKRLSKQDAQMCLNTTNQFGPAFLLSYVAKEQLHLPETGALLLCCTYGPGLFFILLHLCLIHTEDSIAFIEKKSASRSEINFKIIDAGIFHGFESMIRIAGFILICSILSGACNLLTLPVPHVKSLLISGIEITTGIQTLVKLALPASIKIILISGLCSFGGCCGILQTKAFLSDTDLSLKKYVIFKLTTGILSMGIACLFVAFASLR